MVVVGIRFYGFPIEAVRDLDQKSIPLTNQEARYGSLPGIHARVQAMAAEEGRSVANLLVRLVSESLDQRAREAALRAEKDAFVEKLRKQMEPA